MNSFLFKDQPAWCSYLLAIILSLLISAYLFPLSFLAGHGAFFENGDPSQHVSGWWFYLHDQWRFPLGYIQSLNYPEGANVALTDSIPLVAVTLKLFRHWLPAGFHYFGWWHLFAYLLQGVAAAIFIRALGYRSFLATLAAVGFAVLTPALTWRYGHTALTTHGLILLAFSAYVLGITKQWPLARSAGMFIAVSIAALLIHPYLFGMTYPIFLAFLVDFGRQNHAVKSCVQLFILSVLLILFTFFLFGYFGFGGTGDYGYYSMNLLSPLCGGRYTFSCDYTQGASSQYEGFNYLGLGLILVLILILITQYQWLKQLPKRFPALAILMGLFWLFALSNSLYFDHYRLLKIELPGPVRQLVSIYHVSGRMFWPVGYAVMFVGIIGVLRLKQRAIVAVTLFLVLFLQWFDTQDFLNVQRLAVRQPAVNTSLAWNSLADSIVAIDIFPFFYDYRGDGEKYKFFQTLAARKNLYLNTAVLARFPAKFVKKKNFFDPPTLNNHLYIVMPGISSSSIPGNIQKLLRHDQCRQFKMADNSVGIACVPGSSDQWWHEKTLQFSMKISASFFQ